MALLAVRLFSEDSVADLQTALVALQAEVGDPASVDQRGQRMAAYFDKNSGKTRIVAALAYAGTDMPATATADQQFIVLEDDSLTGLQTALNAALAAAAHHVRADADANANAGDITVGAAMFAVGDVGRQITIDGNVRTITAYTSATRITYSGAAITGTGLDVTLHGAESLQAIDIDAYKHDDGDTHIVLMLALEGQVA